MADNEQAAPSLGAASPRLQDVLAEHRLTVSFADGFMSGTCAGCGWTQDVDQSHRSGIELHADHQAAVWREACTIRTVEQLDALPDGAVVRGAGEAYALALEGNVFERSECFADARSSWMVVGWDIPVGVSSIELPAVLLWYPAWEVEP